LRKTLYFLLVVFYFLTFPSHGGGNYWGTTGLIRTPNGRVIEDGDLRFTISQSDTYRNFAVTFGFFPFLELNGRIAELLDQRMSGSEWEGYGNWKDKSADFKILLFQEEEHIPSISIGIEDFHGTHLFHSEYIVVSKEFKNLDFTLGYGGNLLGSLFKEKNTEVRELDGVFGGVEWKVNPNVSFLLEYDPTEKTAGTEKEIESHYNFGLRWKPFRWLNLGYSFQRGREHSFCFAFIYPFGESLIPQKPDEPFYGPVDHTPLISSFLETGITPRLSKICDYLIEEGFSNVKITLSDDMKQLYVEYENKKYLSPVKELSRVLRVVVSQSPSDVERIHITVKSKDIPMFKVSLAPEDFIHFLNGKISNEELLEKIEIKYAVSNSNSSWWNDDITVEGKKDNSFSYGINPFAIESYLNDPSGFYKARVGPTVLLQKNFGKGLNAETYLRFPFFSNVSTNLSSISNEPIRSDIVDYLSDTGVVVEDLFFNKFFKFQENSFYRLTAGYLELQFAGISAEYLKIFKGGKFALGSEITLAKKREPDSVFGLEEFTSFTSFLNGYVYIPELSTNLHASCGKFLAGDKGVKLQITRYIRGGSVFLWYTKTGTNKFTGANRGYSDKGVGFTLPIRVFQNYDCRGSYGYALSPWSRDVGQKVNQVYSLYDFIYEYTPLYITSHWKEIME